MRNRFLKHYGATLLLLLGLAAGGVVGAVWEGSGPFLRPVGTMFLNLIFVLVVPLVFLTVARSMIVMRESGVIGKVLGTSLGVFLVMSLIAGISAYLLMSIWNPFAHIAGQGGAPAGGILADNVNWGDALAGAFTVNDFPLLLSREHLLPLIVFSALFGLGVAALGKAVPTVKRFVEEGSAVMMKMMELVMKLAPIGLGCYFADVIGQLGGQIVGDYLQIFLAVTAATAVCYILFQSLYALFCHIPLGRFWREMIAPSATAVGTCSSAACMPVSMASARNLGVSAKIADGVIPLGTNLHKDGSVVTSVAKVLFALYFFGILPGNNYPGSFGGIGLVAVIILLAVLESIVVGAIPVGGMTGELLICAVLGLDPSFAATLLIIGTICDIPATLLNATGNLTAALLVQRLCPERRG